MRQKPIAAIVVLSLVVAASLVAGCSISTTTQTHDAFLDKFLSAFKNETNADPDYSTKAWDVTWINGTSARVEYTAEDSLTGDTYNLVMTITAFPTTQDATNYLAAMNKTDYTLVSTRCTGGTGGAAYQEAAGHAPQICKDYQRLEEGDSSSISEYREFHIFQMENLVMVSTIKGLE
jgi:hypothetical protein